MSIKRENFSNCGHDTEFQNPFLIVATSMMEDNCVIKSGESFEIK